MKKKTILLSLFIGVAAGSAVLYTGPNRADLESMTVAELQRYCNAQPVSAGGEVEYDILLCREVGREIAVYQDHGDIECDLSRDDTYTAIRQTLVVAPEERWDDEAALYIIEQWLKPGGRCRKI